MASTQIPAVRLDLSEPPEVHAQGRSTHGVQQREDRFRLPRLWSLHLYGYHASLDVDGQSFSITPGTVSLVPPATDIRYRYRGPSTHLYAHLLISSTRPSRGRLAMVMSPGAELPAISDLMESAVVSAAVRPERTRADIWSVLLRLADRPAQSTEEPSRAHVVAAMSFVEARLTQPLTVPQIAAAVGISAGHLTRLFTAEVGETVVGYVRRRRIDQARSLLSSSTMSISAIAAAVGFADLQSFNKACRAVTGRSPRGLRAG